MLGLVGRGADGVILDGLSAHDVATWIAGVRGGAGAAGTDRVMGEVPALGSIPDEVVGALVALGGSRTAPTSVSCGSEHTFEYTVDVRLGEWAKTQGVHHQTAWRGFRDGTLPVPAIQTSTGVILVQRDGRSSPEHTQALACVPGSRLTTRRPISTDRSDACTTGPCRRPSAWSRSSPGRLRDERCPSEGSPSLSDPNLARWSSSTVTASAGLARMNTELVDAALSSHGRRLVVPDDDELDDDLVRDTVEVRTSFCARPHGKRSARNRAERALRCARHDVGPRDLS